MAANLPTSLSPCALCDRRDAGSRCGGCLIALYCGGACQKAHWRAHKPACLAGQALPFFSQEEASAMAQHIQAQRSSADFQPRAGPPGEVDAYELQHAAWESGSPANVLATLACRMLRLSGCGIVACVEERDGAWFPLLKAGDSSVPGMVLFKCANLGVDPSFAALAKAAATYDAIQAAGRLPLCPVYFSSRWQAYMHC